MLLLALPNELRRRLLLGGEQRCRSGLYDALRALAHPDLLLALLREAAARTVGLQAFDEQLLACCALLSGHGVEMDTVPHARTYRRCLPVGDSSCGENDRLCGRAGDRRAPR
ncbi:hypothetical protein [Microbacterium sp. BH-3-3-3]|uniref:hypothetical protein n=1 Tax=Microbacterium sp. BH-3-3-3 TaxID=1906742 RepID=UPI0035B5FFF8